MMISSRAKSEIEWSFKTRHSYGLLRKLSALFASLMPCDMNLTET
jgi:hypothetical protein